MGHQEHRRAGRLEVPCAVLTVSDTRDESSDRSGGFIRASLRRAGHPVAEHLILRDEPRRIVSWLRGVAKRGAVRAVLITGGTGIAPRDRTHEAVSALLQKTLPGFGELFRALSYRQVGAAAMLSRAVAGTFGGMIVFSMPGSEPAVRLAMRRLILPELGHAAALLGPRGRGNP
jgi:molybdopterin adenylyltransferase